MYNDGMFPTAPGQSLFDPGSHGTDSLPFPTWQFPTTKGNEMKRCEICGDKIYPTRETDPYRWRDNIGNAICAFRFGGLEHAPATELASVGAYSDGTVVI